jgi:hypothetical protein
MTTTVWRRPLVALTLLTLALADGCSTNEWIITQDGQTYAKRGTTAQTPRELFAEFNRDSSDCDDAGENWRAGKAVRGSPSELDSCMRSKGWVRCSRITVLGIDSCPPSE